CFALERWPAEQWGHPVRVVDSPLYGEARGPEPKRWTWTIYKSLEAIPPQAYERIGLEKPELAGTRGPVSRARASSSRARPAGSAARSRGRSRRRAPAWLRST